MSARDKIRKVFEANVGKIVTTKQLSKAAGILDYQRRIRELRNDEGMEILSYRDRPDLKPNQYILKSLKRTPRFSHRIDKAVRARILERNGFTCRSCGAEAGAPDPYNANRKITLHVDHENPDGPTVDENLRTLCHNCNEGRSNTTLPPAPQTLAVLRMIRRLSRADQKKILDDLQNRFIPPKS